MLSAPARQTCHSPRYHALAQQFGEIATTHVYPILAALLALSLFSPFVFGGNSEWEDVFVRAAGSLYRGESIYAHGNYSYPPFMALGTLPFTFCAEPLRRTLWFAINLACLWYVLRTAWQLAGGTPLPGDSAPPRLRMIVLLVGMASILRYAAHRCAWLPDAVRGRGGPVLEAVTLLVIVMAFIRARTRRWSPAEIASIEAHIAYFLGLACALRFLLDCFAHQQTDVCSAALMMAGCQCLHRDRPYRAALALGVAAAMKCTPLLWVGYLVYRGHVRPALLLVAVALGLNLLPDLVCPTPRNLLLSWFEQHLQPMAHAGHAVGTWGTIPLLNQSLAGTALRWFTTTAWIGRDGFGCAARAEPLLMPLRISVYSASAVLLGIAALALRRPSVAAAAPTPRNALEFSVVFLLMLLLSPMSGKAHFGTLILPGFVLSLVAVRERRPSLGAAFLVAILLASVSCQHWHGVGYLVLWSGGITIATLVLFLLSVRLLVSARGLGSRGELAADE